MHNLRFGVGQAIDLLAVDKIPAGARARARAPGNAVGPGTVAGGGGGGGVVSWVCLTALFGRVAPPRVPASLCTPRAAILPSAEAVAKIAEFQRGEGRSYERARKRGMRVYESHRSLPTFKAGVIGAWLDARTELPRCP